MGMREWDGEKWVHKSGGIGSGGNGKPGADGYSPTATVEQTSDGAVITITDKKGTTTATVKNGKDGRSAYAYAKDGGYTGTEAEFAAKLAAEYPKKLPNPKTLTINGQSYDGNEPVKITTAMRVEVVIFDNGDGTGTSSHSYEAIKALSDAGWTIVGRIDRNGQFGLIIGVMSVDNDVAAISGVSGDGVYYAAVITIDGVMTGEAQIIPKTLPNPMVLTINGQHYDGQEKVDFTETINGMIDDKLGVIENGAY